MAATRDYYKLLGVEKTATEKEIKAAYRKLARKNHPDVNPGDKASEERFKEVSEAYEVLKDPEKRAAYDRFGPQWQQWQRAQEAGGQQAYGDPDGSRFDFDYSGGGDFSSIFEQIFGGASGSRGGARIDFGGFQTPPQDLETTVDVSLEEAYSGGQRQVNVEGRKLTVKIPAGVQTGSKIRIPGEAKGSGRRGGHVYLNVNVMPHQRFTRDKDNLLVDVEVPFTTALLGGEVAVPTMTGRVKMKVPSGVQSGQTLRLQGKGMPKLKGGGNGDLLARVMITVPKKLGDRERELVEQLRETLEGAKQ